ncbi:response regulator [Pseudoalteromonas luteoviolacea]|uniref:Response regulatory domain-containing protein n=1 Tax=Pseudoalteromonas luteoviolacea S4060-1 TaxID=1365257 RepID=A0A167LG05_9GAMM|nr:response regulator [Pseudoalteromonas luteoviolacea]KZN64454.1 hypothetical protein N478_22420 [Pseudoalteromonas luteoviolacea S4060-1]
MIRKASRVLIIDDDKLMLRALSKAISRSLTVSDVVTLNDPLLAESYLAAEQADYDLIISDFQMPQLSGKEVLTIAKHCKPKAMRIIVSGDIAENLISKDEVPANYFMQKPFSKQDLKLLEEFLRRAAQLSYSDEQQIILGMLPYFPYPSYEVNEALNQISLLNNIHDNQLLKLIEKAVNVFKTESAKLEFTPNMIRFVATAYFISIELMHIIGVGQQYEVINDYLTWSSQACSIASDTGSTKEMSELVYLTVFTGYIEYLIQQYFSIKSNIVHENKAQLYSKFLLIWGIDSYVVENRLRLIQTSPHEKYEDLISNLFIKLNPHQTAINISQINEKGTSNGKMVTVIEHLRSKKLVLKEV